MEDKYVRINSMPFEDIGIVIPVYNPDNKLIVLVNELMKLGAKDIIV